MVQVLARHNGREGKWIWAMTFFGYLISYDGEDGFTNEIHIRDDEALAKWFLAQPLKCYFNLKVKYQRMEEKS